MRHPGTFLLAAGLLVSAVPITAQAQENKVDFSLSGGYTQPNSEVSDRLGGGYNFNIGLQVNVTPVIGIEGMYSFNGLGEKQISVDVFPPTATPPIAGVGGGIPTNFFGDMNMRTEPRASSCRSRMVRSSRTESWAWASTIARSA